MRLLLDENLDWRLRRLLPGHAVESVPLIGWAGIQNGEPFKFGMRNGECGIRGSGAGRNGDGARRPTFAQGYSVAGELFVIGYWAKREAAA